MFGETDFQVFEDPTLAGRMAGIKSVIDVHFEAIAPQIIQTLDQPQPVASHIAKHLRRTKNPPMNTWIAFNQNARGYKKTPHLMLGFWDDRLFLWLASLAEATDRTVLVDRLERLLPKFADLDAGFELSGDHMVKRSVDVSLESGQKLLNWYRHVSKADFLVGRQWYRDDPIFKAGNAAEQTAQLLATVKALRPFYNRLIE